MSCDCAAIAQLVERILGKDEVSSSNLDSSSIAKPLGSFEIQVVFFFAVEIFAAGCYNINKESAVR